LCSLILSGVGDMALSIIQARNYFFCEAEDGIRDFLVTGVQTCALPISGHPGNDAGENPQARSPYSRYRAGDFRSAAGYRRNEKRSEERRVGKEYGSVCEAHKNKQ